MSKPTIEIKSIDSVIDELIFDIGGLRRTLDMAILSSSGRYSLQGEIRGLQKALDLIRELKENES